jgi:hypothetical protein
MILRTVLCDCEIRSLTLREEKNSQVAYLIMLAKWNRPVDHNGLDANVAQWRQEMCPQFW